jgi:hypothetical protein
MSEDGKEALSNTYPTREAWRGAIADPLKKLLRRHGSEGCPASLETASAEAPSHGGTAKEKRVLGEC